MSISFSRLPAWLRTAFLAVLVLGIAVRPMLMTLCEGATTDHQAPAHAHAHGHAHEHSADEDLSGEQWHDHGEQDQLQLANAPVDLVRPVVFQPVLYGAIAVPTLQVARAPAVHVAGPFRPPIG
jgi:hypothetical protein